MTEGRKTPSRRSPGKLGGKGAPRVVDQKTNVKVVSSGNSTGFPTAFNSPTPQEIPNNLEYLGNDIYKIHGGEIGSEKFRRLNIRLSKVVVEDALKKTGLPLDLEPRLTGIFDSAISLLKEGARENDLSDRLAALIVDAAQVAFKRASILPSSANQQPAANPSAWEAARRAQLPERAIPYAEGKRPGESVLDYFERVWGPYRDAKVLYQDDMERLGDPNMLKTVRTYCLRHKLDAEAILPPPFTQRDHDELAEVDPASRDAAYLRAKILSRNRKRRFRRD